MILVVLRSMSPYDENDIDNYINKHVVGLIINEVERQKRKNQNHFPYHDYLNEIMTHIAQEDLGWVIILDDDNVLTHNEVLSKLAKKINDDGCNPNNCYVWKHKCGDDIVPNEINFGKSITGEYHFGCYCFHSSQHALVHFDTTRDAPMTLLRKLAQNSKFNGSMKS